MSEKTGTENRLSPKTDDALAADVQNKSNEDLLIEIENILVQGENMDTVLLEHYLDVLQERDPVETNFNPEAMWNQLENEHPLLFEENEKAETTGQQEKQQVPNNSGRRLFRLGGAPSAPRAGCPACRTCASVRGRPRPSNPAFSAAWAPHNK